MAAVNEERCLVLVPVYEQVDPDCETSLQLLEAPLVDGAEGLDVHGEPLLAGIEGAPPLAGNRRVAVALNEAVTVAPGRR